jgi:hypothetical protein
VEYILAILLPNLSQEIVKMNDVKVEKNQGDGDIKQN